MTLQPSEQVFERVVGGQRQHLGRHFALVRFDPQSGQARMLQEGDNAMGLVHEGNRQGGHAGPVEGCRVAIDYDLAPLLAAGEVRPAPRRTV